LDEVVHLYDLLLGCLDVFLTLLSGLLFELFDLLLALEGGFILGTYRDLGAVAFEDLRGTVLLQILNAALSGVELRDLLLLEV
jgi:hypothetical protein